MAAAAKKAEISPFAAIGAEVKRRAAKARTEKQQFNQDFREAYSYVMPFRIKPNATGSITETRPDDATDNFSSLGEEVCTDFASDMADTFIPEHAKWAGVEVSEAVPAEFEGEAKEAAEKDTKATFASISASNFHEVGKQAFKDLAVSTVGLSIQDPGAGEPARCQVIPIGELLILRDGCGNIGTRFWERNLIASEIYELFPNLNKPREVAAAYEKNDPNKKFCVLQGCYRDYSTRAEHAWIQFTQIAEEVLEGKRMVGIGSANILVARWDPDPNFAWGIGPAIKSLADFRELDEVSYLKLKGTARQVDPSVAYDDDQVINLEGGLPNGVAIPRMKGSTIDVIESRHGMDAAIYAKEEIEARIRRNFYQDGPVQKGKTPPTYGQWADEVLQKQRRLGTPAAPLWQEFLAEAYMRFRWLLVQRKELEEKVKVGGKYFPIKPINPLKRAAQQEEAVACERVLTTYANLFGAELLPSIVNIGKTAHNIKNLSHADGIELNTADAINEALKQQQQLASVSQAAPVVGALARGQ